MTNEQRKDFCIRWLNAWTGNRPDLLIQFYHEKCKYIDPAKPQGISGREELMLYFKKLLAKYPTWQWSIEEIFPSEQGFVLKWKAYFPELKDRNNIVYGMDIVDMLDDKIIRNEVYFDASILK